MPEDPSRGASKPSQHGVGMEQSREGSRPDLDLPVTCQSVSWPTLCHTGTGLPVTSGSPELPGPSGASKGAGPRAWVEKEKLSAAAQTISLSQGGRLVPLPPENLNLSSSTDGCGIWASVWQVRSQFFWFCSQPTATSGPVAVFLLGEKAREVSALNVPVLPFGVPYRATLPGARLLMRPRGLLSESQASSHHPAYFVPIPTLPGPACSSPFLLPHMGRCP